MKTAAKTTRRAKASSTTIKKVEKKNVEETITIKKSLKWIYPEDCKTPLERKAFRQQVKSKIRAMERQINSGTFKGKALTKKEISTIEKKLETFKDKVINPNYTPAKNWIEDLV